VRQFLALELPGSWRHVLDERCRSLSARLSGWRWPRIDGVHLTLRFLGDVDADRDAVARRAWYDAVRMHAPFELRLDLPGRFPERGRPRILWAGIQPSPSLDTLAAALESAARESGFAPETREFRPHLTLARAKRGPPPTLPDDLAEPLRAPAFAVSEVILFESVLDRSGARYTALARFGLDAAVSRD